MNKFIASNPLAWLASGVLSSILVTASLGCIPRDPHPERTPALCPSAESFSDAVDCERK